MHAGLVAGLGIVVLAHQKVPGARSVPILELKPHTCSDAFYSLGREQPTSMRALSNLVPAPDTLDQWVARPAATLLPGSNVFTPGFVSAQIVIGNRLYGMVSSALNASNDQPFCYDLVGQALVSISGITAGNTPTSPAATGAWTAPHMELIGTKIIVTHPGFSGAAGKFFGVIDTSNPGALAWSSANTATNLLPSVPVWVSQFGGRAYYYVNPANAQPAVIASDVLDPLTVTNGSFILTFGDNIPLLCGGPLSLSNQLGGIIQGLIVFKSGAVNMYQVTGDFALLTTAINSLNVATGTLAPNSITTTPKGLMFLAPDGLRLVDFQGNVSDPVGVAGSGMTVPFIFSVIPSRMCAASNATTIRLSTQNGSTLNNAQEEWCFDFSRGIWHGPHTFPVSLVSEFGNSFIVSPIGLKGLWQSDIIPNPGSVYLENGAVYVCDYRSPRMPERAGVMELNSVKSIFYCGPGVGTTTFDCTIFDDADNVVDTVGLSFFSTNVSWDHFIWGSGALLGAAQNLAAVEIPWGFPIVFDRMSIDINVTAAAGIRFGDFLMEYNPTGYTAIGPVQPTITFTIPPPVPPVTPPPIPPLPPIVDPTLPGLLACMGSQPSPARQILINNALVTLRSAGLLAKLDILYVMAVEASDQSLCNWVDPIKFHGTLVNAPAFTVDRGWLGGVANHLSSNWIPSSDAVNFTLDNASIFAWSPTSGVDTSTAIVSNTNLIVESNITGSALIAINESGGALSNVAAGQSNGLYTVVRPTHTTNKLYINNTEFILNIQRTATTLDNTATQFATSGDKTMAIMGAGAALTVNDIASLYSIFSTYLTAVGCPL